MINPFAGPSFVRTFGLVFLSIAVLSVADAFLAKMERAESRIEAARQLEQGRVLMQSGRSAEAIKPIKAAISTERGNRYYLRTLAEAQFAAGKTADSESTLTELLQADATDGPASLIMGRVLVKEGRPAEAISYFHRAIDGDWSENAAEHRLSVRFELIDLLAQRGSKKALLAELLPIEDDAPRDAKTRTRMGRLFLLAESPARGRRSFSGDTARCAGKRRCMGWPRRGGVRSRRVSRGPAGFSGRVAVEPRRPSRAPAHRRLQRTPHA
jgi:tetratricopeptide (TPR) repeat protein